MLQMTPQHVAIRGKAEVLAHAVERRLGVDRGAVARAAHVVELWTTRPTDFPDIEPETASQDSAAEAELVRAGRNSQCSMSPVHDVSVNLVSQVRREPGQQDRHRDHVAHFDGAQRISRRTAVADSRVVTREAIQVGHRVLDFVMRPRADLAADHAKRSSGNAG